MPIMNSNFVDSVLPNENYFSTVLFWSLCSNIFTAKIYYDKKINDVKLAYGEIKGLDINSFKITLRSIQKFHRKRLSAISRKSI